MASFRLQCMNKDTNHVQCSGPQLADFPLLRRRLLRCHCVVLAWIVQVVSAPDVANSKSGMAEAASQVHSPSSCTSRRQVICLYLPKPSKRSPSSLVAATHASAAW